MLCHKIRLLGWMCTRIPLGKAVRSCSDPSFPSFVTLIPIHPLGISQGMLFSPSRRFQTSQADPAASVPLQPHSTGVTGVAHLGHSLLGGWNELQLPLEATEPTTVYRGETEAQGLCSPGAPGARLRGQKQLIKEPSQGARRRGRGKGGAGGREGCAAPLRVFLLMAISAFSRQTKARAWLMSLPVKLFKQTLHIKTE